MTYCRSRRCTCRPPWRNQGSWGLCTCHFLCNLGSTEGIHLNSFLHLTNRPEVNTIISVYNLLCRLPIWIRNRDKTMFKSWAASCAASANCRPAFLLWFVIIYTVQTKELDLSKKDYGYVPKARLKMALSRFASFVLPPKKIKLTKNKQTMNQFILHAGASVNIW